MHAIVPLYNVLTLSIEEDHAKLGPKWVSTFSQRLHARHDGHDDFFPQYFCEGGLV